MKLIYAGIGSRETPERIQNVMTATCNRLAELGFTLNSGGADGADTACEAGAIRGNGETNIYLPWKNFNGHSSSLYTVCDRAIEMAKYYHPRGRYLSGAVLKLMGRNCYQVLTQSLQDPVNFVLCWTKDGMPTGGTGQAMRIAIDRDIPIFNLYFNDCLDKLHNYMKRLDVKGVKA